MASAKPKLTEKGKKTFYIGFAELKVRSVATILHFSFFILHSTFYIGYAELKVLHLNFLLASSITSITLSHHASNSGSSC